MNQVNIDIVDFEQIETDIIATARAVAGYYQELKKVNLPQDLIVHLTAEFARQWWTDVLGLNEQHVFMHSSAEDEE